MRKKLNRKQGKYSAYKERDKTGTEQKERIMPEFLGRNGEREGQRKKAKKKKIVHFEK